MAKSKKNEAAKPDAKDEQKAEPTPIEKCKIMHDKGMGEDEIIGALAKHDGMSIMKAVGVYKKFQKAEGLILSKEERVERIAEIIAGAVTTETQEDKDGDEVEVKSLDIKVATDGLMKELDISAGAAKGHIRRYCKTNDIEMPTRQQMAVAALEEFKTTVVNGIKAGKPKAAVVKELVDGFEAIEDEKQAKRIYSRIAKAEGLQASRGTQDHTAVIAHLKEHGDELETKEKFVTALVAELEVTESAAKRYWNFWNFTKQFNAPEEAPEEAA